MEQKRSRSWVLWAGIASIIAFILGNWGLYDAIGLTDETFRQLVNLILGTLAVGGVINNPTDKVNW